MTDTAPAPRRRLSRRALRAWAWLAGAATFASPAVALAVQPKPDVAAGGPHEAGRPVIIVRKVTRRVIVREPATSGGVRYVYTGGGSSGSTTVSSGGGSGPPPATTTGGS